MTIQTSPSLSYWPNEAGGRLPQAITKFITGESEAPHGALTSDELDLIKTYFLHWAKFPAFELDDDRRQEHCAEIESATTTKSLWGVYEELLKDGIDPL